MGQGAGAAPRVDCVGPLNMDLLIRGHAPADPAELVSWVGPSQVELLVAGSIGYTVQALARLGCAVRVYSAVGDDAFGAQILRELGSQGIDVSGVAVVPGMTSIAIYPLLFGGTKRPMTYQISDARPWPDSVPADTGPGRPDGLLFAGLLHFRRMYRGGMAATLAAARAAGIVTALDAQFPLEPTAAPWLPHISDVLACADVFFCDENEAENIFCADSAARAALAALDLGCQVAVVKLGDRGAVIADRNGGLTKQPAVDLGRRVNDAVGAGDSFDAGFLTAFLSGADPVEAGRRATATAACSLLRAGGARAIDPAGMEAMLPSVPPPRAARP